MELANVYIENFRSIKRMTFSFEPRCRVLVGLNESGKSNILAALSHLDRDKKIQPSDLRELAPEEEEHSEAYIRFEFDLSSDDTQKIADNISTTILGPLLLQYRGKASDLVSLIRLRPKGLFSVDVRKKTKYPSYWQISHLVKLPDGFFVPRDSASSGEVKVRLPTGEEVDTGGFHLIHHSCIPEENLSHFRPAKDADLHSIIGSGLTSFVKANLPSCVYWTYDEKNLLPSQIDVAKFIADPASCEPLRQMFCLAGFVDIATAFADYDSRPHGRRNLLEKVARQTNAHLRSAWAEYSDIEINLAPNGVNIDASVRDKHNHFAMTMRSDGFKRFVSFLLLVSAKVKSNQLRNVLYVHDEPDLGLHPSGIKYLRDELLKISLTNWVAVSTHSIFLVDKERIERHVIVRKTNEISELVDVTASNIKDEEVIYNALGFSIYEELRPFNLVFEGWRDKRLFKQFGEAESAKSAKTRKILQGLGLCHAKGVKDVGRVTDFLDLTNRGYAVVSDSDAPALEQQKRSVAANPELRWLTYGQLVGTPGKVLTAEDFIELEALAKAVDKTCDEMPSVTDIRPVEWSDNGVMADLKAALDRVACSNADAKEFCSKFKASIFDSGAPLQIRSAYRKVFEAALALRG